MATKKEAEKVEQAARGTELTIAAPNMKIGQFIIRGTAPLIMNAFPKKAIEQMKATQEAGSTAKKGKKREPKDFNACYEGAKHVSEDGWYGIPAPGIRAAMVSACRVVGFAMTRAKLAVFVVPDGFDRNDGTPLVRITKGEPQYVEHPCRNASGVCDIRARAMWKPGWEAMVQIQYDGDMFTLEDVANLLVRVGVQVGLLEGRHDSKASCGQGWGTFTVVAKSEVQAEAA